MSGSQFYDNADRRSYTFPGITISAAAVIGTVQGPPGKVGRVRGMSYEITTTTTTGATVVTCGNNGAVAPAQVTVPVATAPAGGEQTAAEVAAAGAAVVAGTNDVELAADTEFEIASDGAAGAGVIDLHVTIDWF